MTDTSDSDEDAPEQLTLSTGREEAHKLKQVEREGTKRVQAEAKQRRQKLGIRKKQQLDALDVQREASSSDTLGTADVQYVEENQGSNLLSSARSGLLDKSILEFLSAQERRVVDVNANRELEESPPKPRRAGKLRKTGVVNSSNRVRVVLLKDDQPNLAKLQNAREFKQARLYGEHIQRSLNMLPRAKVV